MTKQGWFTTAGRPGDRTLDSQKIGLERLYAAVRGKTLLDVGCAEGLLTMDLVSAGGAVAAHGVPVSVAPMSALWGCNFNVADDNCPIRLNTLGVLADNQWSLEEIASGKAWGWLNK